METRDVPTTDPTAWEREIRALEEVNRSAFLSRDLERLDAIWSDHLVVNSPINRIHEKRVVLDLLQRGIIAHATFESDIEILRRLGDLVLVMGGEVVTNIPDGPIIRRRFTNVWRAEGGSWRLVARHANVISDAAAGA